MPSLRQVFELSLAAMIAFGAISLVLAAPHALDLEGMPIPSRVLFLGLAAQGALVALILAYMGATRR